jgi:hypothetical protein
MKIPAMLTASLALAAATPGLSRVLPEIPRFALLNLPDSTYLQMELDAVPQSQLPAIDSVTLVTTGIRDTEGGLVRRVGTLHVWWSFHVQQNPLAQARTVQITRAIPVPPEPSGSMFKNTHSLRIDTVVVQSSGSPTPDRVTKIPHVDNSQTTPRMYTDIAASCSLLEDSVRLRTAIENFTTEWTQNAYRAVLEPTWVMTLVAVTPWTRTTGLENLPGIAAALPGNRGNWLDLQAQLFRPTRVGLDTKVIASRTALDIVVSNFEYTLPTGWARYVYNRSADPWLKILETDSPRWIDSVVKIGPTLTVEGSTRDLDEGLPFVDSLMGKNSWLVLARSGAVESVDSAMRPTLGLCESRPRVRAWKIKDSIVWLNERDSIPLAQLLSLVEVGVTGIGEKADQAKSLARVYPEAGSLSIELAKPASVRVLAPDGRSILRDASLGAGRHRIETSGTRGLLLVQVRQGATLETHRLIR